MKKSIATILTILVFIAVSNVVYATSIAKINDLNITEFNDSIEIRLDSNQNIIYNIVKYMDGKIGVKLLNASLESNIEDNSNLNINKQKNIDEAIVNFINPYDVEILLKGDKLSEKQIKVNNNIKRSNFILIEPENNTNHLSIVPPDMAVSSLPIVGDLSDPVSLKDIEFESTPQVEAPIAMLSNKQAMFKGEKMLAQAQPIDENILDLSDEPLTTQDTSVDDKGITESTSSSEVPEDQTKDVINVDNVSNPEVSTAKDEGLFGKIINFAKEKWKLLSGICACGAILFIALIVAATIFGKQRSPEGVVDSETEPAAFQRSLDQSKQIDNDPVNFIPPSQSDNPKSVTDAINKIISLKNKDQQ